MVTISQRAQKFGYIENDQKFHITERVQPDNCDELLSVELGELTVSTELCPTKTTYYFFKGQLSNLPTTLNVS